MKKRLLSALCAVMLLICAVPMASAQSGDDTRMADALTVLHILAEEPDRDLTAPATRAQAAVLLVHLAGAEQAAAADNPMGRNATPEDVAPAMAFLLSEEARFITGVTLPVTGGSAIV